VFYALASFSKKYNFNSVLLIQSFVVRMLLFKLLRILILPFRNFQVYIKGLLQYLQQFKVFLGNVHIIKDE